jgi:hypothetical protein
MNAKLAIVIGRHIESIPGVVECSRRDIMWPTDSAACVNIILGLVQEALRAGATAIVLQNSPGQVVGAINYFARLAERTQSELPVDLGIVVAMPRAERETEEPFQFSHIEWV